MIDHQVQRFAGNLNSSRVCANLGQFDEFLPAYLAHDFVLNLARHQVKTANFIPIHMR